MINLPSVFFMISMVMRMRGLPHIVLPMLFAARLNG
jgi:hypothetical protein